MTMRDPFYHSGMRVVQDRFGGRDTADAIHKHFVTTTLTEEQIAIIAGSRAFFVATSWDSHVDCSMKCGKDGFVRVMAPNIIEYPEYNGNSMYRTLGNLERNPNCGLLFVDLENGGNRLRLRGQAQVFYGGKRLHAHQGACAVVRVRVVSFPNCSRYRPRFDGSDRETYDPANDVRTVPKWKTLAEVAPTLPESDPHFEALQPAKPTPGSDT
ncbi:hypothetical protein GCM10007385_43010 [Tateyamaria omphalii]|nr:hypothetical protein GCM10007385_43010 [Tateyamaria omphalii]